MTLGDSTRLLPAMGRAMASRLGRPFDLLFTSPPYYGVTNYHYDQWLRLWMLGGNSRPGGPRERWNRKFEGRQDYANLLRLVLRAVAAAMAPHAMIYVRTDARRYTLDTTKAVLQEVFPSKQMTVIPRPMTGRSQTALFGDAGNKPGDVDLILG